MADQLTFSTAEKAADTLYQAIKTKDSASIKNIFGAENIYLLNFDEVEDNDIEQFVSAWQKSHKITTNDDQYYYIEVGINQWTFPVPLIKAADVWLFDVDYGAVNINIRRIGRNELDTIETVLAYYDAQQEYAKLNPNNNKAPEYAQKFRSTEGKKDGLYWPTEPEEPLSPLGSLLENRTPETAYNGYYYKILTSQGNYAEGGAIDYIVDGKISAGFALIAWPSEYNRSGIMSFMINQKGIVYEKDLGPDTQQKVSWIKQFNPAPSWNKLQ